MYVAIELSTAALFSCFRFVVRSLTAIINLSDGFNLQSVPFVQLVNILSQSQSSCDGGLNFVFFYRPIR